MKYETWLDGWLENYVRFSSKNRTYAGYSDIVRLHVKPGLGHYEMSELNSFVIQKYIAELLRNGNLRTKGGLSSNYVNLIISVIKSSLKTAKLAGVCGEDVSPFLRRPKIVEKRVTGFTLTEQKKIEREVIDNCQRKSKLFGIVLCLYTGIRIGELLALEWSDVNFQKHELSVSKTCYDGRDGNGKYVRITDAPKTSASCRIIPLPSSIMAYLRELKKNSHSGYIVGNGSKTISVRSYQKTFCLLLSKLKIQHKGFHALRHTFATRAMECGTDVKTLSELLGHSSSDITLNRYVHPLSDRKKLIINKLGKML